LPKNHINSFNKKITNKKKKSLLIEKKIDINQFKSIVKIEVEFDPTVGIKLAFNPTADICSP
jgi:hypothetical protein